MQGLANSTPRFIALCIAAFSALLLLRRRRRKSIEPNAVTLVTGGNSGIGLALAIQFAKEKNKLVLVGRDEDALKRAAEKCRERGALDVLVVKADLMTSAGTSYVIQEVQRVFPNQLKYLVLNAGAGAILPFSSDAHFEKVCRDMMEINCFSNIRLLQGLLPILERNHTNKSPSRIIGMSSLAGVLPSILRTPYTASKHGFQGFMNALRGETRVKITLCCPGYVDTDFHQRASAVASSSAQDQHNQRRGVSPDSCAQACINGAFCDQPEVIMTLSGKLGYILRPIFTDFIDQKAKKKSLDSLKH